MSGREFSDETLRRLAERYLDYSQKTGAKSLDVWVQLQDLGPGDEARLREILGDRVNA